MKPDTSNILQLEENLDADVASIDRIFGGETQAGTRRRGVTPEYKLRLAEATTLLAHALDGSRKARYLLQEALTIPDFPALFGDVIDRQLLAKYRQITPTYRSWVHLSTVADFRTVKRFVVDGSEATLAVVRENDEYPESKLTDDFYSYFVQKRGRRIPFSWETYINDDLQALQDIPERFANAAMRSEELFATQLLCDASGPKASFFTTGNHNLVKAASVSGLTLPTSDNPHLSIAGLQSAYMVLSQQRDKDGEPIVVDAVVLVVPPALEVPARNILNATELWLNAQGGDSNLQVHTVNWMKERVTLEVDYMIPRVVTAAAAHSMWALVADPNTSRPAFEVGFLRGHQEPEMFMKTPNAVRVGAGGGMVNPEEGDFDSDTLHYKVRHVFGGTTMEPRAAVASFGTDA